MYVKGIRKEESKEWIVMLHGFGGSSAMWRNQVNYFKNYYNILLIDLYGHHKSTEKLSDKGLETFEELGEIVIQIVKDYGIEKANFMGMSMGCMVIGGILKQNPNIVDKVILGGAVVVENKLYRTVACMVKKVLGHKYIKIPYMWLVNIACFIIVPRRSHKAGRQFYITCNRRLGPDEFKSWLTLAIQDLDVLKEVEWGDVDALIVMGSEDYVCLDGVRKTEENFKGVSIKIIEKCGHLCSMQKAEEFNKLVMTFLSGNTVCYEH